MSIFGAFALYQILKRIKPFKVAGAFVLVTIFVLSFTMASSTVSNTDSPQWLKESTVSNTTYTIPEVRGAGTLTSHFNNISSDGEYSFYVLEMYGKYAGRM